MQTPGVAQCLKLISRKGCEKIVRLAFEFARAEGRSSVACATKSNIMKLTEGLLKRTFEEIAPEYPDIEAWHIIVDNCAHQLVKRPEQFDVIVTTNMNGDILSDLTSGLIGGLGFAPSANLGSDVAIFEAVHGSAPKYAGKDVDQPDGDDRRRRDDAAAPRACSTRRRAIENALLVDARGAASPPATSSATSDAVGTVAFTDAIIERLDRQGRRLPGARVPADQACPQFSSADRRGRPRPAGGWSAPTCSSSGTATPR